jgi:hypothetical protein
LAKDLLGSANEVAARGLAANVLKKMATSMDIKGKALVGQAAASFMAGAVENMLQDKIASIEKHSNILEDWEKNPKGMLNAVALSILSGELSENAFVEWVCKSVETIPELGYFACDVKGPDGNSIDAAVDEELRTRRGLLAAYRIVVGDPDIFFAEGESGDVEALKSDMVKDLQEWMTKRAGVRDESSLQALLTVLSITHLGKVSSLIADVVLKIPGAFQSLDGNQHIEYILDNEHMWDSFLPSFVQLDPEYRDWIVAGFRTRFLFEQFEKLECAPHNLKYLGLLAKCIVKQTTGLDAAVGVSVPESSNLTEHYFQRLSVNGETAMNFFCFYQILNIAGAHPEGKLSVKQWRCFKECAEQLCQLVEKSPQEVFDDRVSSIVRRTQVLVPTNTCSFHICTTYSRFLSASFSRDPRFFFLHQLFVVMLSPLVFYSTVGLYYT